MGFRIDAQTIFEHRHRADRPHLAYRGREVTMSDTTNLDYVNSYRDPRMAGGGDRWSRYLKMITAGGLVHVRALRQAG